MSATSTVRPYPCDAHEPVLTPYRSGHDIEGTAERPAAARASMRCWLRLWRFSRDRVDSTGVHRWCTPTLDQVAPSPACRVDHVGSPGEKAVIRAVPRGPRWLGCPPLGCGSGCPVCSPRGCCAASGVSWRRQTLSRADPVRRACRAWRGIAAEHPPRKAGTVWTRRRRWGGGSVRCVAGVV